MFLKLRNDRLIKYAPVTTLANDSAAAETTSDVLNDERFTGSNKYLLFESSPLFDLMARPYRFHAAMPQICPVCLARIHP